MKSVGSENNGEGDCAVPGVMTGIGTGAEAFAWNKVALDCVSCAIVFWAADGTFTLGNSAAQALPEWVRAILDTKARLSRTRIVDEVGRHLEPEELPHRRILATDHPLAERVIGMRSEGEAFTHWYEIRCRRVQAQGALVGVVGSLVDVSSARQQTLAGTTTGEHSAQQAAMNAPGVIFQGRMDSDGQVKVQYISPEIERLYGMRAETWFARPDWMQDAILEEDRDSFLRAAANVQSNFQPFDWEGRTRTARPGEILWIHVQSRSFLGNDGIVCFNGIITDITQSKRREAALRSSEERFRLVVEQTQQLVYDVDVETGKTVWVGNAWNLIGMTSGELETLGYGGLSELIHPEDRARVLADLAESEQLCKPHALRYRLRRQDHSYVWIMDRGTRIRYAGGNTGRLLGTISEVTAEMAALAAAEDSRRRAEALIVAIPDSVIRLSSSGVVLDVRHAAPWMLPTRDPNQCVAELRDLLPAQLHDACLENVRKVVASKAQALFCLQANLDGRDVDFEVRISPSGTDEAVMVFRDVTEARTVDRMKDQFISTVSHELRTPLASIRGSLGLMAAGIAGDLTPMTRELAELALENTKRLERIINDLLDLESIDSGQLRLTLDRCDLRPLLERNIHAVTPFAASLGLSLRFETTVTCAEAMVDADRFGQVVSNLLSNALKHSRPDCDVVLSLHEQGNCWRIEVQNQGEPIPERSRSRLFQRFAMVDASDSRKRGGTGLGLAIARALVERMSGRIDYQSDAVETRFFFELPRVAVPVVAAKISNSEPLRPNAPFGDATTSRPWSAPPELTSKPGA